MITPKESDFSIHPGASKVNGWTKQSLMALPRNERP